MVSFKWLLLILSMMPIIGADDDDLNFDFGWSIDQCVDQDQSGTIATNQLVPLFFLHEQDSLDCDIPALQLLEIRKAQTAHC